MSITEMVRGFKEIFSGSDRWSELGENGVDDYDMRDNLSDFINAAEKELKIVAGEFNHKLYDTRMVIDRIEQFLQKPDAFMQIVFGEQLDGNYSAEQTLKQGNPDLYCLALMYPDTLHVYIAEHNPKQHYGIADGKNIFFEEPEHNVGRPPNYLISRINDPRLVRNWEPRFNDYLEQQTTQIFLSQTIAQ